MPDEFAPRSFPNNPSPIPGDVLRTMANPPRPAVATPQEEVAARPPRPAVATPQEEVAARPQTAPALDRSSKDAFAVSPSFQEEGGEFWASAPGADGRHKLFFTDKNGETTEYGDMSGARAKVLDTVASRNEVDGSYRNIPENVFVSLHNKELGILDHVHAMYTAGKAGTAEGMIMWQAMTGKMPEAEALDKSDLEILKMQVDSPLKPWSDGRLAAMVSRVPWVFGKAAQAAPSVVEGLEAGVSLFPKVALGATALAATGGPAGLAALSTPAGFASILGASSAAGMFDFTFKVTSGSIYGDLRREGVDPKLAKRMALMAGILAGSLEVVCFKYFTAGAKRVFLNKVMGDETVKKMMSKWYVNYLKETGAEAGVESVQQLVEEFTKNFALISDGRPELMKSQADIAKAAGQAGLDAFVGFGALKAPIALIEGRVASSAAPKTSVSPAPAENVGAKTLDAQKMNETLAAAPKAPEIEQALVAETPEVAQSLADLNAELNPASEDAFDEYSAMGEDLVGNENAQAAVVAKIEALRSEMSDIFSERENTPQEQSRVIDIQKELGLLTEMQKRMEAPAVFDEDFGEGGSIPVTEGTAPLAEAKPIAGVAKRVQDVVLKAREAKLVSELQANTDMTAELMRSRARLEKAGKSTLGVDKVLATLQTEALRIDEARRKSTTLENGVASTDKIEVTPATLASIGEAYFKEGRKDVNVRRTQLLNDVAEQYGLSDADMAGLYTVGPKGRKSYLMNRNMGLMSDYDFKRTLDAARESAKILADRKQAMAELGATQEEMNLKKEANLRKFLGFPRISEMTADQMREYAGVLETFQNGDIFWSAKRIDALKNTRWAGAKTAREVLEKLAAHLGVDPEVLKGTRPNQSIIPDVALYDAPLSKQNPIYAFLVDSHNEAHFKHEGNRLVVQAEHLRLAKAALASRNQTIGRKVANWFLQTQPELMAYREETDPKRKAALGALLTEEELAQDAFYTKFMADAYEYLIINGAMMSSRYTAEGYMAHYGRPLPEIIAGIGEVGIRQTLTDIWDSFKLSETQFSTTDSATGQTLSLRKFTDRSLFRTGELKPTQNIIRAFDVYAKQLSVKKTLDDTVPSVETAVLALDTLNKDEAGKAAGRALHGVIKDILNAKKGQYIIGGSYWTKGGKLDTLVSAVTSLVSLKFIGANYALQATMWAGEGMAAVPVIGSVGLAKAQYRMATKQGRAILKTHENFVGQGVLHDLTAPGETVTEKANVLLYGLAKQTRVWGKSTILLGSMTDAEFAAGRVSDARLAEIQAKASRWMDLEGSGSAIGGHSLAKVFTQFRKWAVPIMHTTAELSAASLRSLTKLGDSEKRLNASQVLEIRRLAEAAAIAGSIWFLAGKPDDRDDSWTGKLKQYWMRDVLSPLQGLGLTKFTAVPVALKWMEQVGNAASALVTEGDIKPLGKAAPIPNAINPFKGKKKKAPTRFKFQGEK